ncbi:MAG: Ig-like domain-containing protein, partial [Planctomycetota bacterium]
NLDYNHSIFGQLIEGEAVREAISETATNAGDRPINDVTIESIDVFNDTENAIVMIRSLGGTGSTNITIEASDADGNMFSRIVPVTVGPDTVNNRPYLNDITPPSPAPSDGTATFAVSGVDVENDPVAFRVVAQRPDQASASVDQQTGQVTVTPVNGFTGTTDVQVVALRSSTTPTSDGDQQIVPVTFTQGAPSAPSAPVLVSSSDSGRSNSDRITNAAQMTFEVSEVTPGANVRLVVGGVTVGQVLATSSIVSIQTNNIAALGDGTYSVTAVQTLDSVDSAASDPLTLTYDGTEPTPQSLVGAPPNANVGVQFVADFNNPEERQGLIYGVSNAPAGLTIDPDDGVITWTPTAAQIGDNTFDVTATDIAGNVRTDSFTVNVADLP